MLLYIKEILREGEKMNYCDQCGEKLIYKENGIDGKVPFCPHCQQFKFPAFNSAISAIVFNPDKDKILLIQQYGKPYHVLVAGYINKGENAKEALVREIKEELNADIIVEKFALDLEWQYPNFYLYMSCFECVLESDIELLEHMGARWLSKEELDSVEWIQADIKAVNYIKESLTF
jgi:NADH pyrophosphatase NudC (nudix superfamily)